MISNCLSSSRITGLLLACFFASFASAEELDLGLELNELRAQVVPAQQAVLSAEMNGRVDNITVREGVRVKKGEKIISFACDLQKAQLDKSLAQYKTAVNLLNGSKRMAELNAIGEVELANASLEVDKANADVEYLKATIKRCDIKAPFSGVVGDLTAKQYELVQIGAPLIELIDDSVLQLEFIAPSQWLSWLEPGISFDVFIDDLNKEFTAEVNYTAAKVDAMSRSIKVVGELTSDGSQLKAGMSGRVRLVPPSNAN